MGGDVMRRDWWENRLKNGKGSDMNLGGGVGRGREGGWVPARKQRIDK